MNQAARVIDMGDGWSLTLHNVLCEWVSEKGQRCRNRSSLENTKHGIIHLVALHMYFGSINVADKSYSTHFYVRGRALS